MELKPCLEPADLTEAWAPQVACGHPTLEGLTIFCDSPRCLIKATHLVASKTYHPQSSAFPRWAFPHRLSSAHLNGTQQVLRGPSLSSACSPPSLFFWWPNYLAQLGAFFLLGRWESHCPFLPILPMTCGSLMGKKRNPWTLSKHDCLVFVTHRIFNH